MPKVKGPLFSLGASGTFARALVYEDCGDIQRVRRLPQYAPDQTPLQQAQATKVAQLSTAWKAADETTKNLWRDRAPDFALNGYALWWREWFAQSVVPPDTPNLP